MKLKLSKKAGIFISIGILVILAGGLGMVNNQKLDEKSKLETQLASAKARLQGIKLEPLSSQPVELENQLRQITPELVDVKAKLAQYVGSANATAAIFTAAKTNNLVVIEVTSSSPTSKIVEGVSLSAISMTAIVKGKASKMTGFITGLHNLLKTSVITSVEITTPETTNPSLTGTGDNTTSGTPLTNTGDNITAGLQLTNTGDNTTTGTPSTSTGDNITAGLQLTITGYNTTAGIPLTNIEDSTTASIKFTVYTYRGE